MARFVRSNGGYNEPIAVPVQVGASQTIVAGDIIQVTSGLAVVATAASTTIIGIAQNTITTTASPTASDIVYVIPVQDNVFRITFTPGTKTTFAQADLYGAAYDLGSKTTINPDDTTGGMCVIVGFNNTNLTVDAYFLDANVKKI